MGREVIVRRHWGCSPLGGGPTGVSSWVMQLEGGRPGTAAGAGMTLQSGHPEAWHTGFLFLARLWPGEVTLCDTGPRGHTPASCMAAADVLRVGRLVT